MTFNNMVDRTSRTEEKGPEGETEVSGGLQITLEKVRELIRIAKKGGYKYAADNLNHYVFKNGRRKKIPARAINKEKFIIRHLRESHLPQFAKGAEKRLRSGALKVNGPSISMFYLNSVQAPLGTDLYYALGGWTIRSEVIVVATKKFYDGSVLIKFLKWDVSCSDEYNWDKGKATFVQLYGTISDEEMHKLETSGPAHSYSIEIEKYNTLYILNIDKIAVNP
ncbi:MAG: hypothetical protein ACFFCI_01320 [Promethearchaeota archaeon]